MDKSSFQINQSIFCYRIYRSTHSSKYTIYCRMFDVYWATILLLDGLQRYTFWIFNEIKIFFNLKLEIHFLGNYCQIKKNTNVIKKITRSFKWYTIWIFYLNCHPLSYIWYGSIKTKLRCPDISRNDHYIP